MGASVGATVKRITELTKGGVHYAFECIGLKQTTLGNGESRAA